MEQFRSALITKYYRNADGKRVGWCVTEPLVNMSKNTELKSVFVHFKMVDLIKHYPELMR